MRMRLDYALRNVMRSQRENSSPFQTASLRSSVPDRGCTSFQSSRFQGARCKQARMAPVDTVIVCSLPLAKMPCIQVRACFSVLPPFQFAHAQLFLASGSGPTADIQPLVSVFPALPLLLKRLPPTVWSTAAHLAIMRTKTLRYVWHRGQKFGPLTRLYTAVRRYAHKIPREPCRESNHVPTVGGYVRDF